MRSMRQVLAAAVIVLCGLFGAATLGYAAYLVSRDSVGLPVTKLDTPPQNLAPAGSTTARPKPKPKTVVAPPPPPAATTGESGDDHGGSRGGSGGSGGGHGGDD
jgi:uncharacterized membrane protein YgcG